MNKNLLILGAGGHGRVVKETAEEMKIFNRIDFLDDGFITGLGKLDDYSKFRNEYEYVFVAIGNNDMRAHWLKKLISEGYTIPVLVHPRAYVSTSSQIEEGTIILPLAAIHTNTAIKKGSIIGVGALIDHDVVVNEFCHINTGAIIGAGTNLGALMKVDAPR